MTFPSDLDRWFEQADPRESSARLMCIAKSPYGSRRRSRKPSANARRRGQRFERVDSRAKGSPFPEVEAERSAAGETGEEMAPAAEAAHSGLSHAEDKGGANCSVHGVSTLAQDVDGGFGCLAVRGRDGAAARMDRQRAPSFELPDLGHQ
jgi:hypothetical protein